MPNEIFLDLQSKLKNANHIAFAYSYYYLISTLYRYCKYDGTNFTQSHIKSLLGYAATNKQIDYIIKKNGVLDQINYTQSITDYPYSWSYDTELSFDMWSTIKQSDPDLYKFNDRNYKIKYPMKCFHRTDESRQEQIYDGTFYEIENTHSITIDTFSQIINSELGVTGFYLYAYLKHKCDMHKEYSRLSHLLAEDTKLKQTSLKQYISILEHHNLIQVKRDSSHKDANAYTICENVKG